MQKEGPAMPGAPSVNRAPTAAGSLAHQGLMMSQNLMFATHLAYRLSADVPGVKSVPSPNELKDAACFWAVLMAFVFVPQSADSH